MAKEFGIGRAIGVAIGGAATLGLAYGAYENWATNTDNAVFFTAFALVSGAATALVAAKFPKTPYRHK